jgi:hypothetical protein
VEGKNTTNPGRQVYDSTVGLINSPFATHVPGAQYTPIYEKDILENDLEFDGLVTKLSCRQI